jgi:hypothetical protein
MGLEGGSHLFQVSKSQTFRIAQPIIVAVSMNASIRHPTGTLPVPRGAQAAPLPDKAEG